LQALTFTGFGDFFGVGLGDGVGSGPCSKVNVTGKTTSA
jgi:hypothetical protein